MSCCPADAWGALGTEGYVAKGVVEKVLKFSMFIYFFSLFGNLVHITFEVPV